MEQDQFQSYEQDEGFKPGHTINVIPALDRLNARLNAADQAALAQVQANNRTRVQNSKQAGQDLIALSKMSKTLTDALVERQKGINEDERLEGVLAGQEAALAGTLDTTKYDEGMAQAKQIDNAVQDVGADLLSQDPKNYEAVSQLTGKTTWRSKGFREGYYGTVMTQYNGAIDSMVVPTDYQDSASYSQARALARKAFFKKHGLHNASKELLAQTVYPKIAEAEARALSKWQKTFAVNDSEKTRVELAATLAETKDVHSYLNAVRNTVDSNGNPLGFAGAWKQFDSEITELRKAGMLTATDVQNMAKQPIPGDPKGRTYGQLHGAKFKNIEKQIAAQVRTDFNNSQADRRMEFQKAEQEFVDSFLDRADTDGYTDEQLEEAIETLESTFGMKSTKLAVLKANTVNEEIREDQEKEIKNLISMGLLSPERLRKYDPKLQSRYMSTAQQQAKLSKESNGYQKQMDAIKDLVESRVKLNKQNANHLAVGLMVTEMQRRYQLAVTKLAVGGDTMAAQNALAEITNDFRGQFPDGVGTNEVIAGYEKATLGRYSTNNAESKARFAGIAEAIKTPNAIYDSHLMLQGELEAIVKGYGKPGFQPGAVATFIGQQLNVDPLTVLNGQLKLKGMDVLPPSPAMEILNNQTPQQKQLLLKYKTPERSARGLASEKYEPGVVPGGYGEMIQQSSAKHGIPPSILAGLIETESRWNPNAVSPAGAKGLAQFMDPTAAEFGVSPFNPQSAIDGAAKYLKYLVDFFKGDMRLAIFAYNGGMGNIQKFGGPIPGSQENQEYYGKVMNGAYKYGYGKQSLAEPAVMRPSIQAQIPQDQPDGEIDHKGWHWDKVKKVWVAPT
jgi:hypothetical protein